MQLKHNDHRVAGKCQVSTCTSSAAAVADGKTFFSKKAPEIELCEEHLFDAQDMAKNMGQELVWKEIKSKVEAVAASVAPPPKEKEAELVPVEQVKAELVQEVTQAEQALAQIRTFTIATKEDLEFAAEILTETKQSIKRLDDKRKEITEPMNKALRAANALFKPAINFYEECEKLIKAKIVEAHKKAEEAARIALENAGAAAAEGDSGALTDALQQHDTAVEFPLTEGIQYRSSWKFEITDESKIPREFMTPNLELIRGVVTHKKGATEIPGVRVYEDKIVASVGSA